MSIIHFLVHSVLYLELKLLGVFPRELHSSKMSIASSSFEQRPTQLQITAGERDDDNYLIVTINYAYILNLAILKKTWFNVY